MIAFLEGIVAAKQAGLCLVDVNGVGYEVSLPAADSERLPAEGEAVTLHTVYLVREDTVSLFGFLSQESRRLFKVLLGVNGVGPRAALAVLSGLSREALEDIVAAQDAGRLAKLPGIGKKTAERLILELRDKLKVDVRNIAGAPAATGEEYAEALEALQTLGYPAVRARTALQRVAGERPAASGTRPDPAELVRAALRHL